MKTITKTFSLLAVFMLVMISWNSKAQCGASFVYTNFSNGVVTFTSTSSGVNSNTSYNWNFGNSTSSVGVGGLYMGANTTYTANGSYTVTLQISNSSPVCNSTASAVITVTNAGCNVYSNFNYSQGSNGLVNFNDLSTGTTSSSTYTLDYGDGSPVGSNPNGSHTYAANGNYVATLTVDNNLGFSCSSTKTLSIVVNSYCNLNASVGIIPGTPGFPGYIVSTSTGTTSLTQYAWTVISSSNTYSWTGVNAGNFGSLPAGTYTVNLTIYNSSVAPTCSSSVSQVLVMNCSGFNAGVSHTVTSGGVVNFDSAPTGTNSGLSYTSNWNFGDGNAANGNSVSNTYASAGVYTVTVVTAETGTTGCVASASQVVNVTGIPCLPNANFTLAQTSTPLVWNAVPAYPYNVTNVLWSWGDGSTSNSLYTSHSYASAGTYSICLTVTVSCGSSTTACNSYYIFRTSESVGDLSMIQVNVIPPSGAVTGIKVNADQLFDFNVYPNPSNGNVKIDLSTATKGNAKIEIYNAVGQTVYQKNFADNSELTKDMDLSSLSNGIYFIKLNTGVSSHTKKLVINR